MTTETDVADFLFAIAKSLGVPKVYQWGAIPYGTVTGERVTIQVKGIQDETIWRTCYAEFNICVPYMDEKGTANLTRINQVEHLVTDKLDDVVLPYNGDWLWLKIETRNRVADDTIKALVVNAHLRVRILNIKK